MEPLDIVKLASGSIGLVLEVSFGKCSVMWIVKKRNKTAWWELGEEGLKVVGNVRDLLKYL